ncbi:MAG: hypothetical protein MUC63_06530 [Planctomycetes bacterium]|nr:hypothetical protein [Planctomycetota bacterium]
MRWAPAALLRDREAFWAEAAAGRLGASRIASLAGFLVPACGLYGAVMAGWRSPLLALYVAVKLPLLFLATTAVVALFNWTTAAALGAGLPFRTTVGVAFASMAAASWILLALAPVALFFQLGAVPREGTAEALRFAHNGILVTHVGVLAAAGAAGNAALWEGLRRLVRPGCPVRLLFAAWLAAFAFVGCQLSWILRPFVGSPFYPVAFLREDALERNFYEFVFLEAIPNLLRGGS